MSKKDEKGAPMQSVAPLAVEPKVAHAICDITIGTIDGKRLDIVRGDKLPADVITLLVEGEHYSL
jgi:hypothetical protein